MVRLKLSQISKLSMFVLLLGAISLPVQVLAAQGASQSQSNNRTSTATQAPTTTNADASSTNAAPGTAQPESMVSGALSQGLMLAALALFFYFLVLRPQSKRAKEHRALVTGLQKGDEVITTGGIVGRVSRITDDFLVLNIANDTEILVQRQAISGLLPKGTMKSV